MKQLLQGDAHETFVRLFPQAKLNYSLGYRLNKFHYIPWTEKQSSVGHPQQFVDAKLMDMIADNNLQRDHDK